MHKSAFRPKSSKASSSLGTSSLATSRIRISDWPANTESAIFAALKATFLLVATSCFRNYHRNALRPPLYHRLNLRWLSLTFESNKVLTNLLPQQTLKSAMNLSSVRKNSENKLKSILFRNVTRLAIFWSYRICKGRSGKSSLALDWPSTPVTATSKIICLPKPLGFLNKMSGLWLLAFPDASANKRIGSTIATITSSDQL